MGGGGGPVGQPNVGSTNILSDVSTPRERIPQMHWKSSLTPQLLQLSCI